jgi:hypothetical protein
MLTEKVPNIRILALKYIYWNKKLLNKNIETFLEKCERTAEIEIKQMAV